MASPARKPRTVRTSHPQTYSEAPSRPQLRVISHSASAADRGTSASRSQSRLRRYMNARIAQVALALTIIIFCAVGVLGLRVQLVENAFALSRMEQNISVLTQDVEQEQAQLEKLQASLPDKAQKLGMTTSDNSITVDMKGTGE